MKKSLLLVAAVLFASFSWAQSNKEEIDLYQAAFGMDKKAVVADFVKPSEAQKAAFWKLYDEYETQRKDLGKQRIALLKEYAETYTTMTGVQADAWTKKVIELQKKTDNLIGESCFRWSCSYPVLPDRKLYSDRYPHAGA
jgi:hypothetical protein